MKNRTRIMSSEIATTMLRFLECIWPDVEFKLDKDCVTHNSKDRAVGEEIFKFSEAFCRGRRMGMENEFANDLSTGYQVGYEIGRAIHKSYKFIESAKKNKLPLS